MVKLNSVSQDDFMSAPLERVRSVAPQSMAYAPGGTRRAAVLEGLEPWSEAYVIWARKKTIACFSLIFKHGVRHLFTPMLTSGNVRESNRHRHHIWALGDWLVAGPESIADYQRLGWRVRLLGAETIEAWQESAARLESETAESSGSEPLQPPTLWWTASPNPTTHWEQVFSAIGRGAASSRSEAIRELFGEDIPLISLFLGFGKPQVTPELFPPILMGDVQCYWSQQVGYSLTEQQLRSVFFDNAYLRNTWQKDKLDRAEAVINHVDEWQNGPIVGLGERLGPFWHPVTASGFSPDESDTL